ncbi:MAG: ATP-binding cassette domain-containing protein [Gammaproteobacteria bacterium]|jgi:ATP-binding cassette subfamily B protein|nr:ATP-binding cassette domain-containing protein [Gammaproteobacteria bacterium]
MEDGLDRGGSKDLRRLGPALKFLRPYRRQVIFASIALVVTACATLSLGQGIRLVIDSGFASGGPGSLDNAISLFATFVVVLTIGTFIRFYYVSWVGERISADLRQAVFAHLIHIHPGFFEANAPSEIQSRITTDTTLLQTVIGSSVSIALRNLLMFVGGVVLMFITNAKLSLIVLLSVPLVVLPIILFGRRVRQLSRSSQDRLADVGSYAGESLRHIKVVQSFNHQGADNAAFGARVDEAFQVSVKRIRQRSILVAIVMLVVFGAVAAMLWAGGQAVQAGHSSGGELAAFIFYAFIVAGSVGAISEVISDLQRAAGATERLVELLESPSEILEMPNAKTLPLAPVSLTLEDVHFAYPTRPDQKVIQGVSLQTQPGEMVALVGPSGAGKSTLFDLIQRFYDPGQGVIKMAGEDVRELKLSAVRGVVGYVPQDPVLFAGTLRDNLVYACPEADDAAIQAALTMAYAADFVGVLPEGLETRVGEGGVGLSGGQRQRLAIARALISEPQILLLDEATSALDAESENHIRLSIDGLKGRMTILVIAHRLSTVRQADHILVLEDGQVMNQGTHDQLLEASDLYGRFAQMQFAS